MELKAKRFARECCAALEFTHRCIDSLARFIKAVLNVTLFQKLVYGNKRASQRQRSPDFAVMYAQGLGVSKDDAEAAKWIRKAADQGLAAGQFGLGSMYAHGRGVPRSETEAATWYRKAADQGDAPAMNNLAVLLATSNDPKIRNPKEAVSVAEKAVEVQPENASYLDTLATAYFEAGPTGQGSRNRAASADAEAGRSLLQKGAGEVRGCQPTHRER